MNKYQILLKILDGLRNEAPEPYKAYHADDNDSLIKVRSKCFIHLFLKVTFGILDFHERENFITDDIGDGGIDAYFVDRDDQKIYYIQSKFRNTEANFSNKDILYDELLSMDIARIVKDGEERDEKGNKYNGKILSMQNNIRNLSDRPMYDTEVIILANAYNKETDKVKKAIGGYDFKLYNDEMTFKKLVFPIITSTFYNKEKLVIRINVNGSSNNRAKSDIKTSYKDCNITMLLVPVKEIGRTMSMYKNSILKFNPRSFLSLQHNDVNKNIASAIKEIDSNDFALFNNGVTMLASNAKYSDETAEKGVDQLLLTNPQIINGGQTAYTLSEIYEECKSNGNFSVLENKSVVLKVITLSVSPNETLGLKLIEKISKATNFQTSVEIHDRISNDEKQMLLQDIIYDKYCYFYERKKGEYAEGVSKKYIPRDLIIDKTEFMRVMLSCFGLPNKSRQAGLNILFSETNLAKIEISNIPLYVYAYRCFEYLKNKIKNYKGNWEIEKYGYALRYGSYAVVYATVLSAKSLNMQTVEEDTGKVLDNWLHFEQLLKENTKNTRYFRETVSDLGDKVLEMNYNGYYRGATLNQDIYAYFSYRQKIDL
jgi:hypothetical protein